MGSLPLRRCLARLTEGFLAVVKMSGVRFEVWIVMLRAFLTDLLPDLLIDACLGTLVDSFLAIEKSDY